MVEIIFIGTGGGRINLLRQFRRTGGFRINSKSANIHVDPGPGALVGSVHFHQDPLKLDALVVTHSHIDHSNDANVIIEGISHFALKKRGIAVVSEDVLKEGIITSYHQKKVQTIYEAHWGERKTFKTERGSFELEVIEAKHDIKGTFGFKMVLDGLVIGYTSDTEYVSGLGMKYLGCDYLIVNCLKPRKDSFPGHMSSDDVVKLLKEAKPKLAIITHMGMAFIRAGPKREAAEISKKSGIHVLAGYDGMKVGEGLERFI